MSPQTDVETEARMLIFSPWVLVGGQVMFLAVAILIWLFFKPVVPPADMRNWLILTISLTVLIVLSDIYLLPDRNRVLRMWRRIGKWQTVPFDLVALGVIWLLLPHGGETHRIVITAFCVGYVPVQMISDPENSAGNKMSIVIVLGSFFAFLIMRQNFAMNVLAAMVLLYGLVLFYSADVFRKVVVNALRTQRALEESNHQLAAAVREVSEARDARSRFIAAATHDLGQPIQAARLFSETAITAQSPESRDKALVRAAAALTSAQAMLANMLFHMRLEADAVQPHRQRIALDPLIRNLAQQFEAPARERGQRLVVRSAAVEIVADPVMLERALGNLVSNAVAHSGGQLIRLICLARQGVLRLIVWDDGSGIAPGEQELIFDDYQQGAKAREGFGLGLGSAKRLITLLGGELHLAARRRGACFVITLPLEGQGG